MYSLVFLMLNINFSACRPKSSPKNLLQNKDQKVEIPVSYATGFKAYRYANVVQIDILHPWPQAQDTLTYYFVSKAEEVPELLKNKSIIRTPAERIIATSTTDIPLLEALEAAHTLVGFPETDYISSSETRKRIANDQVAELGSLLQPNVEKIISLEPDVYIGFNSNADDQFIRLLERTKINTLMNGSWLEQHPLGRAEWIKVFGLLLDKEDQANEIFTALKASYTSKLKLAQQATTKPSVLAGNLYKDVWYAPGGRSFEAQLIADANAHYIWQENENTGSLSLGFENVLQKAQHADVWIGGGAHERITDLLSFQEKYALFDATQNKKVFSRDLKKGETQGVLYYELGALQVDLALMDLIKIFHPNLAPNYDFTFYQKLN